jgi:hypothetical protein
MMKFTAVMLALMSLIAQPPATGGTRQFIMGDAAYFNGQCAGEHNLTDVVRPAVVRIGMSGSLHDRNNCCGWDYINANGWTEVDRIVATNMSYGYKIYFTAGGNSLENLSFTQMQVVWSNHLAQIAARYRPYAIEIYNEPAEHNHPFGANTPDTNSPTGWSGLSREQFCTNYAAIYVRCYDAIKAVSPRTLVVAMSGNNPDEPLGDLPWRNVMLNCGRPIDAISFHDTRNCDPASPLAAGRWVAPEANPPVESGAMYPVDQAIESYRQVFPNTAIFSGEWHDCSGVTGGGYGTENQTDVNRAVKFMTTWRAGGAVGVLLHATAAANAYAGGRAWFTSNQVAGVCSAQMPKQKLSAALAASAWMDDGTSFAHTNLNREVFIYAWRAKGRTVACFWTKEGLSKRTVYRTVMNVFGKKYSTSTLREYPQYITFLLKSPAEARAVLADQLK